MSRSGSGKSKGSEFERNVCKQLSLWVTKGEKTDLFWRTAMSGGRATVARKSGIAVRQSGDITAVAEEGHRLTNRLYFELKFYKDLELASFFIKQKGKLSKFWVDTVNKAKLDDKHPVLIAKQNFTPSLLLIDETSLVPFVSALPLALRLRATVAFQESTCFVYHLDDILNLAYKSNHRRIRIS